MSKVMQIRVRVEPYWARSLKADLPRLGPALAEVDYDLVDQNPSLLTIIEHLGRLTDNPALDTAVKQALVKRGPELLALRRAVDDALGEWRLSEADKVLYQIEDIFFEIDKSLT